MHVKITQKQGDEVSQVHLYNLNLPNFKLELVFMTPNEFIEFIVHLLNSNPFPDTESPKFIIFSSAVGLKTNMSMEDLNTVIKLIKKDGEKKK